MQIIECVFFVSNFYETSIRNKQLMRKLVLSINIGVILKMGQNHASMACWIKSFRAALVRRGMSARVYMVRP